MRKMLVGVGRLSAMVAIAALCAGVLAPASPAAPAAAVPAAATSTAWYPVIQGNRFIDARSGTTLVPRGANWPGFEYACWQGWGYSGDTTGEAALMSSWNINTVRIPLNQDCWLGLQGSPAGSGRTAEGYRTAVQAFVTELNAAGIVAILDLHTSAPAGYPAHGQRAMPDAQSHTFWTSVATRFASNPYVMFDLFNEPYSRGSFQLTWSCWKYGGCLAPVEDDYTETLSGATYVVVGMDELVQAVRAAGAYQPILLGGLNYSNDLSQWANFAPYDSQVAVSWHNYPGQGCNESCWNSTVTTLASNYAIVTTEFGQTDGGNDYLVNFMDWADAHGIGYLPWAWWRVDASESLSNSRYALVDDNNLPKYPAGTALHDQLAITIVRVAGADRYATSIAISQQAFAGTAPVVYVATGLNYPDALAAGPAAAHEGGPLLLTSPTSLPTAVKAEIARLHPARIVVVGGTAAVSDTVVAQLRTIQANTVRIAGADRYATARAVVADAFDGAAEVYVATGRNFPDALSASATAAHTSGPVVLVDGQIRALEPANDALIRSLHPSTILMAGGLASIDLEAQNALDAMVPTLGRLAGPDRFSTSVAVAQWGWERADTVFLATGLAFPDALSASAWAGKVGAPLIVVPTTCIPQGTLDALDELSPSKIVLVGGEAALSASVAALTPC